jgi:hypothetical protein
LGEPDGPTDKAAPKRGSGSSGEPKEERKDGEEAGSKDAGSSESKDGDKGKASGQKEGQGDKGRQGSSPSSGAQGTRSSEGGNTPGGGGARQRSGDGDSDGRGDALSPQPKAVKPRDHRAAQMQLEDFAKRVNKDILKEAGVSEEAWKKYLESKRRQLTPRERPRSEVPSAPQQANPLPSMGGRTIPSSATGQGDARAPDRGQPPPGYRDSFREFTRQMSEKK